MEKYKLIKELPFKKSPEIGCIATPDSDFEPDKHPEYWEKIRELLVPVGTKFTLRGKGALYTISRIEGSTVTVSWVKGFTTYSLDMVNKFLEKKTWVPEKDREVILNARVLSIEDMIGRGTKELEELVKTRL